MKRLIALALALVMCLGFCACSGEEAGEGTNPENVNMQGDI